MVTRGREVSAITRFQAGKNKINVYLWQRTQHKRGKQKTAAKSNSTAGASSCTPCGGYRHWALSHAVADTGGFLIPTNCFQKAQEQWHRELREHYCSVPQDLHPATDSGFSVA